MAAGLAHWLRKGDLAPPRAPDEPADAATVSDALAWAEAAGRGRRSAIGTYGFALGGLLVEAGKWAANGSGRPGPADQVSAAPRQPNGLSPPDRGISPLIAQVPMPVDWRWVLVMHEGYIDQEED